jgi:quercetin dioxygenase-like cupin family protein
VKGRIAFGLFGLALLAGLVVGRAVATPPSGLSSTLLARGAGGEFGLHDKSQKLKLHAKEATDVAVVGATLTAGGQTGWHTHPGPSLVVVKTGSLTMDEVENGACVSETFGPGRALVHPEHLHNFRNTGTGTLEFYVVYLVPAGAAPLADFTPPAPSACG